MRNLLFLRMSLSAESYAKQFKVLDSIGIRYRVVPVLMEPGFRFHPKGCIPLWFWKGGIFIGTVILLSVDGVRTPRFGSDLILMLMAQLRFQLLKIT